MNAIEEESARQGLVGGTLGLWQQLKCLHFLEADQAREFRKSEDGAGLRELLGCGRRLPLSTGARLIAAGRHTHTQSSS